MHSIKNLLRQIAVINNKNAEILDATGGRFNIFQICGVDHYENTHSKIIAELLNPNGTHGLKSKLLECFIEILGNDFIINDFDCNNSSVFTEYSIREGRIDILIQNANDAIIIENKIYARDGERQLSRYDKYAQNRFKKYQILYLTLLGNEADKNSSCGVPYTPISYKETIIEWLEKCVEITSRYPLVRETIVQYINHLKKLTHQDMNTKNQEEITEVLSEIGNLKAAKTIYENYSKTYDYLAEKYFNPEMEKYAAKKGLIYNYKGSSESHIKFQLWKNEWIGKCWISFNAERNAYYYGICNNPKEYRISNDNKDKLYQNLNLLGISECRQTDWYPFWNDMDNLSIEKWESDIVKSNKFLEQCKEQIEILLKATEEIDF
ncbi:PD-(D/E)XK nuclease family protein [Capnocytophaga canimorsus]|uniref:PD-(D/E)XK nuclease family protein n=1 Tax=Capnocytophaga canimorsus TaxID=28188 RepID=UPI0037CD98ED